MDTSRRTLAQVISSSQSSQQSQSPDLSLSTYLTVYSINLVHRFPDVSDLNSIDYSRVTNIAEFSFGCARVGLEVWDNLSQSISLPPQRRVSSA